MSNDFRLGPIRQIAINVKDPARATEFYKTTLGLPHLFSAGSLSFFDAGGVRLMLSKPDKPEFDHPSSILYFNVPDIQAAHDALASRGVTFENKPELVAKLEKVEVWIAAFRDSEGNLLALMSEVAR